MENNAQKMPSVFVVKSWQGILILIAWLVLTVLQFASVRAQTEVNSRDIEQLKREQVTRDRFDEMRDDIQRRLQRIEDKLDREKAMREAR